LATSQVTAKFQLPTTNNLNSGTLFPPRLQTGKGWVRFGPGSFWPFWLFFFAATTMDHGEDFQLSQEVKSWLE
jgi:hypothetical protein